METIHTYTAADGVKLHYRLSKSERTSRGTIVLLHGMASNLTRWSEFLEHTSLKSDWDIVRLDLRGHGESFARGAVGFHVWSADIINLLDTLGVGKPIVVGHSLGAHLALHIAGHHSDRIRGIALIDPVFPPALRGRMRIARYFRSLLLFIVLLIRGLNALGLRRRQVPLRDLRKLDEQVRVELLRSGNAEEFVRRYSSPTADMKYIPVSHYIREVAEILRPLPLPAEIAAPMLVLLSRAVTYTDTETTTRLLQAAPDAECVTIDAYHWPLTEQPVQVREAIENWIERRFGSAAQG